MLDPRLLDLLQCPETKQKLHEASPEQISTLNKKIAAGTLNNRAGRSVVSPLQQALSSEDNQRVYPVVDGIPVMLVEESILWIP